MSAFLRLRENYKNGLHICVGLDTDIAKIPKHLLKSDNPILAFNKIIIDATIEHAAAYKINLAFYESNGIPGLKTMLDTIAYIGGRSFVIGDSKRADIGNSSAMYAKSLFESYGFDSITVPPYMGIDSLEPFFSYTDKLIYVLGLTSNPGSSDVQKIVTQSGGFVYSAIFELMKERLTGKNAGIVFGATNISDLEKAMESLRPFDILLPGVGSQGGKLEEVIPLFYRNEKTDFLINISRSLIYCDSSNSFGEKVHSEIFSMQKEIKQYITAEKGYSF